MCTKSIFKKFYCRAVDCAISVCLCVLYSFLILGILFFIFRHAIPTYKINLDLPPRERWVELVQDKKHDVSWIYL